MKLITNTFLFFGIIAFSQLYAANNKTAKPNIGKSVELTESFKKKIRPQYEYSPVIPEFWQQVEKSILEKKFDKLIEISQKQLNNYGHSTPEGQEALLAQAISFYHQNIIYASFRQLLMIAQNQMGSSVGSHAIYYLGEIVKNFDYDKKALFDFVDLMEMDNLHYDIQSFISYFKSINLLKYGHKHWAKKHLLLIDEDSHWDYYRKYMSSLALIGKNKVSLALAKLDELTTKENLHPKLKSKVYLQIARLQFENGEFVLSSKAYRQVVNLGVRQKGRVLLERAWSLYYQKEYSKSLGLLHALKAPFFKYSRSPEAYILRMLIFKDLCHYTASKKTAIEYRKKYKKSIRNIRRRSDLKKDSTIFSMAAMNLNIQMTVNLISKLREEIKIIKNKGLKKYSFSKQLIQAYKRKDAQLQMQVDYKLDDKVREAALSILDSGNQVHFLEYSASLDAVKVSSQDGAVDFKHEAVTKYKFDKIFWPVNTEFWFDELEDYTVNISSQCFKETDLKQLKIEENFK